MTSDRSGFDLRVGGRIAGMLNTLEGGDSIGQPARPLRIMAAQAALAEIAELRIDMKKGRSRDLRGSSKR